MLRSFRLKIGVLSVCLSGGVLLAFGLFFLSVIEKVGGERMDRELRALAEVQIRDPKPLEHWKRFAESFQALYGDNAGRQFVIKVSNLQENTLYVSPQWPMELSDAALPRLGPPNRKSGPKRPPPPDWSRRERPPPPNEVDAWRPESPDYEPPRGPPPFLRMNVRGPEYSTVSAAHADWRLIAIGNDEVTLNIGMNLSTFRAEVQRFRAALLIAVPFVLAFLIAGGWLLAQAALSPISAIARTAERITAQRLDQRIKDTKADEEFKHLIEVINGMLERLERSFQQAVRFSADAAHELKTPLTILQGELEQAVQKASDGSAEQRIYTDLLEEVQRLKGIVRKLLLLAQADSGQLRLTTQSLDLTRAVESVCDDMRILAPTVNLKVDIEAGVKVEGDADLLNQVFQNLTSNALKFNDQRGWIEVILRRVGQQAIFTISNTGVEIPKEDKDKVFERFYRANKSRSRQIDGAGLGLSLAREIARAHGGILALERSDEQLTTFLLTLPIPDCLAHPSTPHPLSNAKSGLIKKERNFTIDL